MNDLHQYLNRLFGFELTLTITPVNSGTRHYVTAIAEYRGDTFTASGTTSFKLIDELIFKIARVHGTVRLPKETEWADLATRFDIGICAVYGRPVTIEKRAQIDGRDKWVVKMDEWVLSKRFAWVYEPMPSSRTSEFIEETRFDTKESVYLFWKTNIHCFGELKMP